MTTSEFPPCGLYRTTRTLEGLPEGRLVYFHDHGDPGPGAYLPSGWQGNRARFHGRGQTLSAQQAREGLEPLLAEGFYVVVEGFHCCEKQCRRYEPGELAQLGYDGNATPILFTPQWKDGAGLDLPERGTKVEPPMLAHLSALKVPGTEAGQRRGLH